MLYIFFPRPLPHSNLAFAFGIPDVLYQLSPAQIIFTCELVFTESKCYFLLLLDLRKLPQKYQAEISGSIPGHGWVFLGFCFLFTNGNLVDLEVNILCHY